LKRIFLIAAFIAVAVVVISAAYVGVRVRSELIAARSVLSESPATLTTASIEGADDHLEAALGELNSVPAKLLRLVPVARQNLVAVEAVARDTRPVLQSAADLERVVQSIESKGLMSGGRVDLDLVARLESPLKQEVARLRALHESAQRHQSGWLAPLLWDEINTILLQSSELRSSASKAHGLVQVAGRMLGAADARTYLIVLLNNAELRGAGGIPSGVGTLNIRDGILSLGHFDYAPDLRGPRPFARVKAPADFRRRYGRFWADRTFWINTTISSDVPDVAEVAARLFEVIPGRRTNGILFADPHGVAALMRADATIELPGSNGSIGPQELPDFAYSTVYEQEEAGIVDDRHDALLKLGELAFREILTGGFGSRDQLSKMAGAFAAGHLRFVSFDPVEQKALQRAGATGDLRPPQGDSLFVTAYSTGADKMDYWGRRSVEHHCIVDNEGVAECSTSVTLRNVAPNGLPRIVAGRPYGVLTNFLEVYIPQRADLKFVERNGEGTTYFEDRQDGHTTIGFNLRLEPGDQTTVEVGYDLSLEDAYTLDVMPQPLTHSAPLDIVLELPEGWVATGPDGTASEQLDYSGSLTRSMSISAAPESRTGLSGLWDRVVRFWNEPLG
jgi:hypothetical protein